MPAKNVTLYERAPEQYSDDAGNFWELADDVFVVLKSIVVQRWRGAPTPLTREQAVALSRDYAAVLKERLRSEFDVEVSFDDAAVDQPPQGGAIPDPVPGTAVDLPPERAPTPPRGVADADVRAERELFQQAGLRPDFPEEVLFATNDWRVEVPNFAVKMLLDHAKRTSRFELYTYTDAARLLVYLFDEVGARFVNAQQENFLPRFIDLLNEYRLVRPSEPFNRYPMRLYNDLKNNDGVLLKFHHGDGPDDNGQNYYGLSPDGKEKVIQHLSRAGLGPDDLRRGVEELVHRLGPVDLSYPEKLRREIEDYFGKPILRPAA